LTKASDDVELHLVDFMRVELGIFKKSSMVKSFTTEPEEFEILLQELKEESKRRLQLFDNANLVNISSYNRRYPKQKLPYILIVIDEFASLAEHKDIMKLLKVRLAQDRKCGIHYIICTQRPSVDIISGTIKVNIPTRIALKMCTDTDSQVVLDQNGAEKLSCVGRALVKQSEVEEIQVAYLGEQEARRLVKHTFIRKAQAKVIQKPKGWIEIG
jgi:S-DNA-T family DNA segregation ATPase FtsK/SpoIIIE